MRKFLLTLTTGLVMASAAATTSQATWVYHRPVVYPAPIIVTPPVYVEPVVSPVVYTAPVFPPFYTQRVVLHRWHGWAARRVIW